MSGIPIRSGGESGKAKRNMSHVRDRPRHERLNTTLESRLSAQSTVRVESSLTSVLRHATRHRQPVRRPTAMARASLPSPCRPVRPARKRRPSRRSGACSSASPLSLTASACGHTAPRARGTQQHKRHDSVLSSSSNSLNSRVAPLCFSLRPCLASSRLT